MHIAFYARAWPLGHVPLGVVTYVHCMRDALIAQGHRVSVFADLVRPGHGDADVHPVGYSVRRRVKDKLGSLLGRPSNGLFAWGEVIAETMAGVHRRDAIDVVEMEESFGWFADVQRLLRVPVVVKLHGPAFLTEIGPKAQLPVTIERVAQEGRALGRVAAVISPSRCTLDAAIARYGRPPGLIEHVPNPVLVDESAPLWRLDACDRRTILFVGRFDGIKGGDVMVQAFAELLDSRPDARLVFVGPDNGLMGEDGSIVQLADFARATLGADKVHALSFRGKLDAQQIQTLRTEALMTVMASRWENQSYTALEAMVQGCPTIGTDGGGTPEIIEHGVSGLLFKSGDASDLCRAMATLMEDSALCERLGARAREYVLATHTPATVARHTTAVYARTVQAFLHPEGRP